MEENDYRIDEVFDTRSRVNKTTHHQSKKHKKLNYKKLLIIIGIIVIIIVLGIVSYLLLHKEPVIKENLVYTEFDPLITKLDNDTYYIFGAKSDITFEITPNDRFSYQILDEDKKEVTTTKENKDKNITILPPSESYEDGKTYTLKITDGVFADSKLKDAKKIIFSIARPAANNYTLKENVISLDNPKIENNKLTTDEAYKQNDIIVIKEDNKIINSYKIAKDNSDGTYELTSPKIDEVFETIDYYGMEKLNLSAFTTNEELKNYLIGTITNNILNSLVDTVYAKENIEIKEPKWNQKTQSLSFSIIIDAKENTKLFESNVKNHQTKAELYVSVKVNLYKNVTMSNYDYALSFEYTINNKANLLSTNDKINELNDNIRNEKADYDATWLVKEYKDFNTDKIDITKSLGNMVVSTEVPGLNVSFDLSFILNTDIKTILDSNVSGKIMTTMGINSNKEIYGSYKFDGAGNVTTIGDGNISLGFTSKTILNFIDVNLESNLNSSMYVNSKSEIKEKDNKDDKENKIISYEVKADISHNGTYNLNGIINEEKLSKKVAEDKQVLKTYQKQFEFTKPKEKKEEKEEDKKPEYKYTKEETIKKLTDAYNELASKEELNLRGGTVTVSFNSEKTLDANNNEFITKWTYDNSVSYTCSYDYLNKNMDCDNFENAQSYIKNACDELYNEYLTYQETGECDNDDAMEWENLYANIDSCYYETIPKNKPSDYTDDFNKILKQANLTEADLEVLKAS